MVTTLAILFLFSLVGCDPQAPDPAPQPKIPFAADANKYFDIVLRAAPAVIDDTVSDRCPNCNGKGWVGDGRIRDTCSVCDGSGELKKGASIKPQSPERQQKGAERPAGEESTIL